MDPGGGGGSGLCPDARFLCGHFRRKLPDWSIALLFKKKQKYAWVIKIGQIYGIIFVGVMI